MSLGAHSGKPTYSSTRPILKAHLLEAPLFMGIATSLPGIPDPGCIQNHKTLAESRKSFTLCTSSFGGCPGVGIFGVDLH